ncbi:MAG: TrkA family potassium uptake protein [Opitutaceae bacterium]|nr:TrkA family potassium uptake protein [Opitutaceae bacterium]
MAKRIFILGGGRFGVHLAHRLLEFGCEVVIADHEPRRVKELAAEGLNAVEMDADDEGALKESGALKAEVVVVAIGENMQTSILTTLLLKQLGAKRVVARAVDAKHAQVLERLGADDVVIPIRDMASRLAERLRDDTSGERTPLGGDYLLATIPLGPKLHGQTLAAAQIPLRYGITAILLKRADGNRAKIEEATAQLRLAEGSELLVVGAREKLNHFERDCGRPKAK